MLLRWQGNGADVGLERAFTTRRHATLQSDLQ